MSSRQRERGATLVEAAFAIPIFFLLLLGLVDFGLVGFNDNQAGNAARDGARAGVISHLEADVAGSSDRVAIEAAIDKNLPGRSVGDDVAVDVECREPDDTVVLCADAVVGRDRIWVHVSWDQSFVSPVANALGFDAATVEGESAMVIVGAPISGGTPSPTPCDVTGVSVSPDPVDRVTSGPEVGQLASDLTIEVSGTGSCGNITVRLVQGAVDETVCLGPSCVGIPLTFPANGTNGWTAGSAAVQVTGDDNLSGSFTIVDPVTCDVTSVVVDPGSVERHVAGPDAGELTQSLDVTVNRNGTCANLTVEVVAPDGVSSRTICPASSCLVSTYVAGSDAFWTAGTASVRVTGDDTATGSFAVTDGPATCTVTVGVSPTSIAAHSNQMYLSGPVQITVTPVGPCGGFNVQVKSSASSATTFNECIADSTTSCTGALNFTVADSDPPDNSKPWPPGKATVTVTGSANAETQFTVT